ncbi:MAG: hypothetical protein AB7T05_09170, partial [Fimbriimonadaceae bacterium]
PVVRTLGLCLLCAVPAGLLAWGGDVLLRYAPLAKPVWMAAACILLLAVAWAYIGLSMALKMEETEVARRAMARVSRRKPS